MTEHFGGDVAQTTHAAGRCVREERRTGAHVCDIRETYWHADVIEQDAHVERNVKNILNKRVSFYANVTFALCRHKSVRLSVCRLSSL